MNLVSNAKMELERARKYVISDIPEGIAACISHLSKWRLENRVVKDLAQRPIKMRTYTVPDDDWHWLSTAKQSHARNESETQGEPPEHASVDRLE